MSEHDFKSFGKILSVNKLYCTITQKIHGSNAQIYIYRDDNGDLQLKTGSRTRWITPDDDNFGFSKFVFERKEDFIRTLGEGRHFGEWAGPGINGGEGLAQKTLVLFNWRRWKDQLLPDNVTTVPILYSGSALVNAIQNVIDNTMQSLKENGSKLVAGYMHPEGIVIEIADQFYKKTFELEEVKWTGAKTKKEISKPPPLDIDYLLQPMRLKKLLSRDSRYLENYPESIRTICADYVKDLEEEGQIVGDEDMVKSIKKYLGSRIFPFIKEVVAQELVNA